MISASDEIQNYIVGTNSSPRNVAEAEHLGVLSAGETLLGIFDGVFYEAGNKRVGGIALNDFLVVSDQYVTLWARDQQRDFVDHFPLSHVFVLERKPKDPLHGTIKLGLVQPDVKPEDLDTAEMLELTFDLIPLSDLELAAGLVDVLGCAHRDLLKGGANDEDRFKASRVLFSQVFVAKMLGSIEGSPKGQSQPRAPGKEPKGRTYLPENEPVAEFIEDDEVEAFMTPLSRLDQVDSFTKKRPSAAPTFYEPEAPLPPRHEGQSKVRYQDNYSPTRLYQAEPETSKGYYATSASGQAPQIAQELRWLNGGELSVPGSRRRSQKGRSQSDSSSQLPPGVRLREELNNSDAVYFVGRAGRTMFDGLDKLRREAESKNIGLAPLLNAVRDAGMNIRDLTEFMVAANDLLDTIGKNPAARDLAMMMASKMLNDGNKVRQTVQATTGTGRRPDRQVEVESAEEAPPTPARPARVKVERRKKPEVTSEVEETGDTPEMRLGGSQTHIPEVDEEELKPAGSQTSLPGEAEIRDNLVSPAKISLDKQVVTAPASSPDSLLNHDRNSKPSRHRLMVRSNNATAGAADGGGLEEAAELERPPDLTVPSGPDLN